MKLLGTRLLIKKHPDEDREYVGGLIIRKGVILDRIVFADVIDIGPECYRFGLKPGDTVVVKKHVGAELENDMVIIKESQVLGLAVQTT